MHQSLNIPGRCILVGLILALQGGPTTASPAIERVEPPFWWAGMKHGGLQLMIHGQGVGRLEARLSCPGVRLASSVRVANPNYLFLQLALSPELEAGECEVRLHQAEGPPLVHRYQFQPRRAGSAMRQGFSPADTIYLVTPDRFANGDQANDQVPGLLEGLDRNDPYGRHGGDLQGVIDHLGYIADMGFTQVWLNPVLENDQPQQSYHGYATTDYYAVDARFGSNALYRELSRRAREKGLGLIMDQIPNHVGSHHWWMGDLPAPDWINHGRFVQTTHMREPLHDPHAAASDVQDFTDGWFVPEMPDLNQRNPLLATYLMQNAIWWIEFADLSGIRVDTWSYADKAFLSDWTGRVMAEYPNFNVVGEEWIDQPAIIAYWQRGQQRADGYRSDLPTLMDFPLMGALTRGLLEEEKWGAGIVRVYRSLANDFLYPNPHSLLVFADNHDTTRVFTALGEDPALFRLAMVLVLTTRGIPQIFYGTEILMSHAGNPGHGAIRSDFPGGWLGDPINAFSGAGLAPGAAEAQRFLKGLLRWRRQAPAIATGTLTHYAPRDGVYVYFRLAAEQRVMVVVNKNASPRQLDLARFAPTLRGAKRAVEALTGKAHALESALEVPARGFLLLEF